MNFIKLRKVSYIVSGVLTIASFIALGLWGLHLGIDFTGGSLTELEFHNTAPTREAVEQALKPLELGGVQIQPSGERGMLVRTRALDEPTHEKLLQAIGTTGQQFTEKRFDSIGPVIGNELKQRSIYALLLVIIMIIIYIAWAFRKVSKPVESWKFGIVAIIALVHDVTIPTGVFAYLGRFQNVEIDALFITAILTILGFSVHDTIVVFDRIRENLRRGRGKNFEETVDISIHETIVRSINTSLTLLFVLIMLYIFGGESTKYFSLALILGTIVGVYSSIFIASPLLVTWQRWVAKRKGLLTE
jgi:preprotein translocase subunit SecF